MRGQRVVLLGPGSAGVGIANMIRDAMVRDGLPLQEATERFWLVGRRGLLTQDRTDLHEFQRPYARPPGERTGRGALLDVVAAVHPTVLIGTSTSAGAFSEDVVRAMAAHVDRPIVLPLSNPTAYAEAAPADVLAWTGGRALVATGSPFPPVQTDAGTVDVAQANNALVFPGLGLGVIVARASRVTDGMLHAAAEALAARAVGGASSPGAGILPGMDQLRVVSSVVAMAVVEAAVADGVAQVEVTNPVQQVFDAMWQPVYPS